MPDAGFLRDIRTTQQRHVSLTTRRTDLMYH